MVRRENAGESRCCAGTASRAEPAAGGSSAGSEMDEMPGGMPKMQREFIMVYGGCAEFAAISRQNAGGTCSGSQVLQQAYTYAIR